MKGKDWKIEMDNLWLLRGEEWVLQMCPYSDRYCGNNCPLLRVNGDTLTMCNGLSYGELF